MLTLLLECIIQETSFLHQEGWKQKLGQLQITQCNRVLKPLLNASPNRNVNSVKSQLSLIDVHTV